MVGVRGKDRKFGMYFYELYASGIKKRLEVWDISFYLRYHKNKYVRITKASDGYAVWTRPRGK